ncbi:SIS domain protein [Halomonas elongata]|uniref:SIS domain protein n=1 Tax=Halomonas elongata TaxID=2746 RepID=A0A1B8P002_HALEL|nr:SIS domain protein [Halomonas elongata]
MTYALHHIDKRTFLVNGLGGMYGEQLKAIGDDDALLVVSFSPYAQETREMADEARKRGVPLVVITDSNLSPWPASPTSRWWCTKQRSRASAA